jgi:hypothetical protein
VTAHEQAARHVLANWLRDPEKALFVAQSLSEIANGRFNGSELASVMGRGWRSGAMSPEQMLMVMFTHIDNCAGRIARTMVRAASEPSGDRFRDENAAALADLPHPFAACVSPSQHGADCDGWLEWSDPIEAQVCTNETFAGDGGRREHVQVMVRIEPDRIPLEIGSTLPSRTRLHLVESGGVARWPYGSDWVYVWIAPGRLGNDRLGVAWSAEMALR